MRNILTLLCAAAVYGGLCLPVYAEEKSGILTVRGEAVTRIAPDQATLSVTVHGEDAGLKQAKEKHDNKLRTVLKLAAEMDIPKEKIQTSYTSTSPTYTYDKERAKQVLSGYQVRTSLEVVVTDLDKVSIFMQKLVNAGVDQMGNITYGLQDERKVKEDTLLKAVGYAYEKASRLAATAKVTLDKPLAIEEGGTEMSRRSPRFGGVPMPGAVLMERASLPAPPDLPEGLMEIRQNVTVTYSLK